VGAQFVVSITTAPSVLPGATLPPTTSAPITPGGKLQGSRRDGFLGGSLTGWECKNVPRCF